MIKIGLGVAGVVGLGVISRFAGGGSTKSLVAKIEAARSQGSVSKRFPMVEPGAAVALENDPVLEDIVERAIPFFQFDEEVGQAFAEACASAAEFSARAEEIEHKRSIPKQFRAFTSTMRVRLKELRRAVRDKAPGMLEEFDELLQEVDTFAKDSHHNMWCDAHSE